jgi:hypothetical protein
MEFASETSRSAPFGELDEAVEGSSITCENDYAARGVEAIGIGFVFSRSRSFVESKMGVFDCRHLDIGILVNHSGTDVVTEEQLANRYRTASVGNSDLGAGAWSADCPMPRTLVYQGRQCGHHDDA